MSETVVYVVGNHGFNSERERQRVFETVVKRSGEAVKRSGDGRD